MRAIIPVAGHGTRLEPHSLKLAKCLFPVAGKPTLEHILDRLFSAGITEIVLIIGHLGDQIRDFCKHFSHFTFYFIEQKERLGLGHAVLQGLEQSDEPILITLGDTILDLDYKKFISSNYSTIVLEYVPDPERFGIVEMNQDRIVNFIEKPSNPPSNLALIGIYYISSQKDLSKGIKYLIDNNIRTNNEYQLTDAFGIMLNEGHKFAPFEIDCSLDCGIPDTIFSTNKALLKRKKDNAISDTSSIINSELTYCTISENCIIHNSKLHNVIMLSGSKVINQDLENIIIGHDECLGSDI